VDVNILSQCISTRSHEPMPVSVQVFVVLVAACDRSMFSWWNSCNVRWT